METKWTERLYMRQECRTDIDLKYSLWITSHPVEKIQMTNCEFEYSVLEWSKQGIADDGCNMSNWQISFPKGNITANKNIIY